MKVTFLNTFEKEGGAGIAADRIFRSLQKYTNIELQYRYQFKSPLIKSRVENLIPLVRIGIEKVILNYYLKNREDLYSYEMGLFSTNLLRNPIILEADIIHLHTVVKSQCRPFPFWSDIHCLAQPCFAVGLSLCGHGSAQSNSPVAVESCTYQPRR